MPVALLIVPIVQFSAFYYRQIAVSCLTFLSIFPANHLLETTSQAAVISRSMHAINRALFYYPRQKIFNLGGLVMGHVNKPNMF